MKKSIIAIITIFSIGITHAQNKEELKKEFLNLKSKITEVAQKHDSKLRKLLQEIDKKGVEKLFDENDFKGDNFNSLEKEESFDKVAKYFTKAYEERTDEDKKADFYYINEVEKYKAYGKEKEYIKILKEYKTQALAIEKKMYEITKKYLSKK